MLKRRAALLLCLPLLFLPPPPALADAPYMGGGHTYYRSHTYTPAAYAEYTVNAMRHTAAGLEEEHILAFEPNSGLRPVVVTADSIYGGGIDINQAVERLRARGLDVVGGINGSFFNSDMSPIGLQVRDGVLTTMGNPDQPAVGFTDNGTALAGEPGYGITVSSADGIIRVDRLNQSRTTDQVFMYTKDYSSTTRTTIDGLHVVIRAQGRLIPGGTLSGTVTRVLTGKEAASIAEDEYVLSANTKSAIDRFSFLREGDDVLISVTCADPRWIGVTAAVGALHTLVRDGEARTIGEAGRAPRTAVGITHDGRIIFYTVDGRQSGHSVGLTLSETAARMADLGCVSAYSLDGGGSTSLCVRMPGEDAVKVVNKPSDGAPRRCADFLLLCNVRPPSDGRAARLFPNPAYTTIMPNATVIFSMLATDEDYRPVPPPPGPVAAYPSDDGMGYTVGASFIAEHPGETVLSFHAGGASGTAQVHVTDRLDSISLTEAGTGRAIKELTAVPSQVIPLTASGSLNNRTVISSARSYLWSVDGDIGDISPDGVFTASAFSGAKGHIYITGGGQTAALPVSIGAETLIVEDFEAGLGILSPGADGIRASITVDSNIVERGRQAAILSYTFATEEPQPLPVAAPGKLPGYPKSLYLLVTGDRSGHELLVTVITSGGETADMPLGVLDFTGARYLSVNLPPDAVSLDGLVLYPKADGPPTGTVYIHQIVAAWTEALPDTDPSVRIGNPVQEGNELVYALTVTDASGMMPQQVTVRRDGKEMQGLEWDRHGRAEVRVPAPTEGLHILSVDAADSLGRRARALSLDDFGRPETPSATEIWDVDDRWFTGYIDFLDAKGIIDTDTVFGLRYFYPQREVTRLEVMVMIARILEIDLSAYAGTALPFADVEDLSEYEISVIKAIYARGIISGKNKDGALCVVPDGTMSHAEIFTILYNTLPDGYDKAPLIHFADYKTVPPFALRAAQTLVGMQIVRGSGDNLGFRSSMSRAEVASLFCRFFY